MQLSGMIVASDGVDHRGLLEIVDMPSFWYGYGGVKLLMREKILNQKLCLPNGQPLIAAAIRAMSESKFIDDFVIVGNLDQVEQLHKLAEHYSKGKKYKILAARGHIGETIAQGAEAISHPGQFLIVQPDLPNLTCDSIDVVAQEPQLLQNSKSIYFPVVSQQFFDTYAARWTRPVFPKFLTNNGMKGYKMLDFVIASSNQVNPDFIYRFYHMRTILSLKGKVNAIRAFPTAIPQITFKYIGQQLRIEDLEEIIATANKNDVKIIEVNNPAYAAFMQDIDTCKDYAIYRSFKA